MSGNRMCSATINIAATVYYLGQGTGVIVVGTNTNHRGNRRISVTRIAIAVGLKGIGCLVIMTGETSLGWMTCFDNATLKMIGSGMADLAKSKVGLIVDKSGRYIGEANGRCRKWLISDLLIDGAEISRPVNIMAG